MGESGLYPGKPIAGDPALGRFLADIQPFIWRGRWITR